MRDTECPLCLLPFGADGACPECGLNEDDEPAPLSATDLDILLCDLSTIG